jgi:hypothetical protein
MEMFPKIKISTTRNSIKENITGDVGSCGVGDKEIQI